MQLPTCLRLAASFIAVALFLAPHVRAADAPRPPIRSFDIATIERLGREIYEQDQLARRANDVLNAKRSGVQADGMLAGWITGRSDGRRRVRFVRHGGSGIEVLYDVLFDRGAPRVHEPADRTLSSDEVAQYNARMLALRTTAQKCSPNYGTVALKDPEGSGFLVWALAATTTDADTVIVNGHVRYTISADGQSIVARDDLSESCLSLSKGPMHRQQGVVVGFMLLHVVSLTPVETHVFLQLSYDTPLYVGTLDGLAWKVDRGRVGNIDMDMPVPEGVIARILAGMEERCAIIATKIGEEPKQFHAVGPDLEVILSTEDEGPFKFDTPYGYKAEGIGCVRRDIVPAPNDYKVTVAGYPFLIGDKGVGHPERSGILNADPNGRFVYDTKGSIDTPTLARIERTLRWFERAARQAIAALRRPSGPVVLSHRTPAGSVWIGRFDVDDQGKREVGGYVAMTKGVPRYVPADSR